jgi:hypothetical protein
MAAELHSISYGFDHAFLAKDLAEEGFGQHIPPDAYLESRMVFNTITRETNTLQRRLQIDPSALRQSHNRGELRNLAWIPSDDNIADAPTKTVPILNHALVKLWRTNKLSVQTHGCVRNVGKSNFEIPGSVD